jgi:hypothetical protein
MADLAVMRDRLRKETAELLGLDINALSAAQSVRLDRCSTLRLEIDDIESRKLQGVAFDAVKYIAVSEALERMVGGNPEQTNTTHDFTGAKEELARLLNQRGSAIEHCEQREARGCVNRSRSFAKRSLNCGRS